MKKPSQVLIEAKALISDPTRWTTKFLARNKFDREVDPVGPFACKWCVVGAVAHVLKSQASEEFVLVFLRRATRDWGLHGMAGSPAILNDRGVHAETMKLLDRAVQLALEKEVS